MKISADIIESIILEPDHEMKPIMNVYWKNDCEKTNVYGFPLISGFGIHIANEFLRSLNLGIEIEFEDFTQYGKLIMECAEALESRKGVNA